MGVFGAQEGELGMCVVEVQEGGQELPPLQFQLGAQQVPTHVALQTEIKKKIISTKKSCMSKFPQKKKNKKYTHNDSFSSNLACLFCIYWTISVII